ncbi:tetratricopeptide repeat protein [Bradyrhizobium sp. INPA03-11B]|uniref:tetratricopeptide repeat protein n=1 Tax=Bradyrhizobium sp. INPA03-11B TaxID=418598 RepID=UPI00338FF12D
MRLGTSAHVWLFTLAFAAAAAVSWPAAADDRQDCLNGSKETAAATIAPCTRAIESGAYDDRDLSNLYNARGYAWSWTNFADRVDHAFKDYTEAIRIDPKAVGALLNRSHLYNHRHDYDRAIADADRAFEGDLSDYGKRVGYGERGYAYLAKGDNDRAIADFTDGIRLDPNNKAALTARGNAYLAKGDPDRAAADYDRVIALDPDYALAYYNRSLAYRAKGDFDRVIADSSEAIALYPNYTDAYLSRGYAYQVKGDPDRAIADYDRVIALNPKYAMAYYDRSLAYRAKGDFDRVIADCSAAIALDPNYTDAYSSRAIAYLTKGDLRRAIADLSLGQALAWLATILLPAAGIWLCYRTSMLARRGLSGRTAVEICEQHIVEMRRRNVALERLATALEKHSSG